MSNYGGRYPAIIKDYDPTTRTCRVSIPGISDGGDVFPIAEIEYPLGDKSRSGANATEIEVLAGDTVWIAFIGGDSRYPIITGYRNPKAGNEVGVRLIHHTNLIFSADSVMTLNAPTLNINSDNVTFYGTSIKHNMKNIGDTHKHAGVQPGSGNSDNPV